VDLLLNNVPPYALRYFEREPGLVVERAPGINFSYLGFNLEDPRGLVSRLAVRRAIAHAIDRDAIIAALLLGQARKADALLAPENWAYAPDAPSFDFDPGRARALLDAEGLTDPDGDGPAPRFALSYKTSTDRLRNRVAEVIADQLAAVGIAVEKRQYEWGTFFADIKAGNFETFTLTWVGVIDPDHLHYIFHSSSLPPGGANRGRFRDARVDAWLDAARATGDVDERRALYRDVQRVVAEQIVYVPLWWADNVVVRTRRLEGFAPLPGGEFTSLARARLVDAP
jgi:peptide/nickel transport system substrate-binding protein